MTLQALAPALDHPAVEDFIVAGRHLFAQPVDPHACAALLAEIRATRDFGAGLFLSEAEFDADPQYVGVNPRAGRNLLERFAGRLGFVERAPQIVAGLTALLGGDYVVIDRKVVCGVPESAVPAWLRRRIKGNPVNNLGAYVRPQFRDVTYFYGIDFHQDLIDYKSRPADFVTLYVYLHPVGRADAPLFVLEGSHTLGGTLFPHDLVRERGDGWSYGDRRGGAIRVRQAVLTGPAGQAAMWHACTLHGTQPDAADHERISLRYVFGRGAAAHAGIDRVNAGVQGPLSLDETRGDLAANGAARMKGNVVSQAAG